MPSPLPNLRAGGSSSGSGDRRPTTAPVAEADLEVWDLNRQAPAVDGLDALARQLLRQESVGSSRIEDLVIGNVRAMERAIALAGEPRPFTRDDVVAIHPTLFEGTHDEWLAGVVREKQNWIGGSAYSPADAAFVPPPPERVESLLDDLATFMNRHDLPVTLQAAIAHAQFETIHPFLDGNGRVGRCLIRVVFRRRDLARTVVPPISLVLATHVDLYIGGLVARAWPS